MSDCPHVFASCRLPVSASADRVWQLMKAKVHHPDKYVPGVTDVSCTAFSPSCTERKMKLPTGITVHELITTCDETMQAVFKIHPEDANFAGAVTNTVYVVDGTVFLEYVLSWYPKAGKEGIAQGMAQGAQKMMDGAVAHAKALSEDASWVV